jgi:hypothetical protein
MIPGDCAIRVPARRFFFLPIGVLSRAFRGKFVDGLRSAFDRGEFQFHGSLLPLAEPRAFAAWLRVLFRHDWVVYSKPPFGGPEHVLRYLGAYTYRVAVSNSRLVSLADGNVTFRWRDSAHGNKKRIMTLDVDEFLRRFADHGKRTPGSGRIAYCSCGHVFQGPELDEQGRSCPYCGATLRFRSDGHPEISVHGVDATEVERVSQALFAKAPETRGAKKQFPLVSAVFFLIMFAVVFGAVLTAARLLPIYVFCFGCLHPKGGCKLI